MQRTKRSRFWLWLIRLIGVIVPRRLRADWRQEWEAELLHRLELLTDWDWLNWRSKLPCGTNDVAMAFKRTARTDGR